MYSLQLSLVGIYFLTAFALVRFSISPAAPPSDEHHNDAARGWVFTWLGSLLNPQKSQSLSESDTAVRIMDIPGPISPEFETRQEEEIDYARSIFAQRYSRSSVGFEDKILTKQPPTYDRNQFGHWKLADKSYRHHDKPLGNPDALFTHVVGHSGVMVDTTRFYYPMERLEAIIEWIAMLGFNTLHLRVIGDNAFAVKLRRHANLAFPSKQNGNAYSWSQLQELSEHAHDYGVEIFPEINVISRAGGWHGGGFLSSCPYRICSPQGLDGIPLNLTNTPIMAVVSNVIDESRNLLNSPFLHLGFDEREESLPCLEEAGIHVDFDATEQKLMTLLSVSEIPSRLVVRWESSETTPSSKTRKRAGLVTHYHLTNPSAYETRPFFVTTDLQFNNISQLKQEDGWSIFEKTRAYAQHDNVLGILAGTMELSPQTWSALNVDGKLIAVAIGASNQAKDIHQKEEFEKVYKKACAALEFSKAMCKLLGKTRLSAEYWETERDLQRELRKNATCDRLTKWSTLSAR